MPLLRAGLRGAIDATEFGLVPGAFDDQSKAFTRLLREASALDRAVELPPGQYVISNITLPAKTRLTGTPGASRIVYGGDGHLLHAEGAEHIELTGIVLDGANRALGNHADGLLQVRVARHVTIDNCDFVGSAKHGIALESCGGRIERSRISGAALAGIYSVGATGLEIARNTVTDCGNGGILVHRWEAGPDGTIVTGNRVERIAANSGGTGQNGNGINVFRAGNVQIANNKVSDCAFSAIRSNSGSNLIVTGNGCMNSGETAIYAEFGFEGAVIASNLVDGATNGISIVNFNEGGRLAVCQGNIVRNLRADGPYKAEPDFFGIGIAVEADTAVTGNVIENAPRFGMLIGFGPYMRDVVATGNVIRDCAHGIGVSVVEGTGSCIVSDNVISRAKNGAIVGMRWMEMASDDLVRDAGGYENLTVERNKVS
jgi:uncharacterized secreted repeat protein (TIGR03808 family)